MKKQEKGITLIALVVTIVVLLILAAVSISMLGGENGIITQAIEAKNNTEIGEEKEAILLAYESCKMTNKGEKVTNQQLEDELKINKKDVTVISEGEKLIVTYNDTYRSYEINQNGEINQIADSDILIKLEVVYNNTTLNAKELPNVKEVTDENVPIPKGFFYVGGTKDTGVVISDVEGDDLNNTLQGNQFVWVPVNQNQLLKIEVKSKEKITEIKLNKPDFTTERLEASGKEFNQEITMEKNGTYEVEVITANGIKTAKKIVTSLYGQDFESFFRININYLIDMIITEWEETAVEKYNTTSELLNAKGYNTVEELLENEGKESIFIKYLLESEIYVCDQVETIKNYVNNEYEQFFKEGIMEDNYYYVDENTNYDSVNKYGGFYIGRYEAGDELAKESDYGVDNEAPDRERKLVVQKYRYVYNNVSFEEAETKANEMYNSNLSVKSQVITGSGWDRTTNWIVETGSKTEYEVYLDSSSWGNYNNSVGNASINSGSENMNYTTGRSEYWKTNNIYDFAGNLAEIANEKSYKYSEDGRNTRRGGQINNSDCTSHTNASVSRGTLSDIGTKDLISFRVQLFINI